METNAYDAYVAFLPLAHVLELICESVMFLKGVRVGYSTPNTLLDKSSMVKRGRKGDASVLRPTVMAAVPLILDRVFKTITEALSKSGSVFEKVFTYVSLLSFLEMRPHANPHPNHAQILLRIPQSSS